MIKNRLGVECETVSDVDEKLHIMWRKSSSRTVSCIEIALGASTMQCFVDLCEHDIGPKREVEP
jgi:hypothetical protein